MSTMKPYRVKRGDKFIGSFIVVHNGKRVNLKTGDASEARRRAALLAKGEWPPQKNAAARAVVEALEGAEPPPEPPVVPTPDPSPDIEAKSQQQSQPAPSAPPPAEGAGTPSPPAAADAVNSVAAAANEEDQLEAQARAALESAGIDLSEVTEKVPEWLSGAHLWMQGQLCRCGVRAVKGKWPKLVTLDKTDDLRLLIGKIWQKKLAAMNLDLEKLGPGWWLLLLSGACAFAQVGGMLAELESREEAEREAAAN
jgi:hypothetical protein